METMEAVAVKERPILFSGEMVRALLDGRKTQTRRVVKLSGPADDWRLVQFWHGDRELIRPHAEFQYAYSIACAGNNRRSPPTEHVSSPYGQPGDRLWVREAHQLPPDGPIYRATAHEHGTYEPGGEGPWRPSIHMPRWASRIILEVTDVRVERVQDISEEDAMVEGCIEWNFGFSFGRELGTHETPRSAFRDLWDRINGPRGYGWEANPWTWAITFRRLDT